MRKLILHETWAQHGAVFGERHGLEVVTRFHDRDREYSAVRDTLGLTDFSFLRTFRIPEDKGIDLLDRIVAGNVPRIRFGRMLHTLIADDDGFIVGDCFVANDDQEFLFLVESIIPDESLDRILGAHGASEEGLEELSSSHAVLSVDGPQSWSVMKEIFGADILGLPFLSVAKYPYQNTEVYLMRAGKTGEFGYLLLCPVATAPELAGQLVAYVEAQGGACCGTEIHNELRLEGRFLNIHAEGGAVRDPLALGLQWMIDFEKGDFQGGAALKSRREAGLDRKICGVALTDAPEEIRLEAGTEIDLGQDETAPIVATCYSNVLGRPLGLALFPRGKAYSGLTFRLAGAAGSAIQTISMPPITPKSLLVKLDEV